MLEVKFKAAWNEKVYEVLLIDWLNDLVDLENGNIDIPFNEVELLQYTGLKDKNGTEVYVGDIVTCTNGCPHEVVFKAEHGGTFVGGMPTWYLSGLLDGYAWTEEEEIIGNIWGNLPEVILPLETDRDEI